MLAPALSAGLVIVTDIGLVASAVIALFTIRHAVKLLVDLFHRGGK